MSATVSIKTNAVQAATVPKTGIGVVVTPEMAEEWRTRWYYQGQRPLRMWHVNNLVGEIAAGRFLQNTQISFVQVGDRYYLTNGQHTLKAVSKSGLSAVLAVIVRQGATMKDVADDYARHDSNLTRLFSASLVAHGTHEDFGVTSAQMKAITASSIFYSFATGTHSIQSLAQYTHDAKMAIVTKHGGLARIALGYFDGHSKKSHFFRKTTIAAAMFITSTEPVMADEFFRTMAADDGLRAGDPRKTLLEYLRTHSTSGSGPLSYKVSKRSADHEFVKAIATAWNAWEEGRDLKVIRVNFDAAEASFNRVGTMRVKNTPKKTSVKTDEQDW